MSVKQMRSLLLRSAIATVSCIALGQGAWAQENESGGLEEITVTAQKRSQSVQDVGIAISALGRDELDQLGVTNVDQLAQFIPNVELGNSSDSNVPIIVIRGVGLQDYNANNTPTTAMYLDDTYLPYGAMAAFTLFDMERVEVLKGPQGGLYGRNTTAGAMNFVSVKPSFDAVEGNISVDAGNYGYYGVRGGVSVPLGDRAAMRIAVQHDKSDGYYRNTYLNQDVGGMNKTLARLTLSFQPTDAVGIDFRATIGSDKAEAGIPEVVGTLDANASFVNFDIGLGNPNFNAPSDPDGIEGPGGFTFCPSYIATGIPGGPDCVNMERFATDGDPFSGVDEEVYEADNKFTGLSLTVNWDIGNLQLLSISALNDLEFDQPNGDGMVGQNSDPAWDTFAPAFGQAVDPVWFVGYKSDIQSWSQEIRLLSEIGDSLNWMAGVTYSEDDFEESRVTLIDGNIYYNWLIFPGGGTLAYDQNTEALSFYGQLDFSLSDQLSLIADVRHTSEEKSYLGTAIVNGGWLGAPIDLIPGGARSDYDEDNVSWKLALNFRPTDDMMLYGSIGEGFKSGGFFGGFLTSPDQVTPYKPETNLAYEVGIKSTLADGTMQLNGSLFFYDYQNWQGNITTLDTNQGSAGFSGLTNMGDVETTGAEFDLRWLATDNLELRFGAGWLDTEVTATFAPGISGPGIIAGIFDDFDNLADVVGNEIPQAPGLTANALARYSFDVGATLGGAFQIDAAYTDDYYLGVTNTVSSRIPGYTKYNLRAELSSQDGRWNVAAWGRNLSDEVYRTPGGFGDGLGNSWWMYSQPRTYGVTFTYNAN